MRTHRTRRWRRDQFEQNAWTGCVNGEYRASGARVDADAPLRLARFPSRRKKDRGVGALARIINPRTLGALR